MIAVDEHVIIPRWFPHTEPHPDCVRAHEWRITELSVDIADEYTVDEWTCQRCGEVRQTRRNWGKEKVTKHTHGEEIPIREHKAEPGVRRNGKWYVACLRRGGKVILNVKKATMAEANQAVREAREALL